MWQQEPDHSALLPQTSPRAINSLPVHMVCHREYRGKKGPGDKGQTTTAAQAQQSC